MPNTETKSKKRRCIEYICCIALLLLIIPVRIKNVDEDEVEFLKYMSAFNKSYNSTKYYKRLEAFKQSLKNIELLNSNNGTATYGFTKFSDISPEEFTEDNRLPKSRIRLQNILLPENFNFNSNDEGTAERIKQTVSTKIPLKVDWREKQFVTKIKSQKSCSACWAFAAIGAMESAYAIKSGQLETLSIQSVIDCTPFDGCDGGDVCALLEWMKANKFKVSRETDYPLTLTDGECKNVTSDGLHLKNFACENFVGAEEEILYLLARNGPVAVAINAGSWQNYIGGTIQFHCSGSPMNLNHAVEIVGYDLTSDVPYYIVRNSWGEDFGDKGYLYIAIGKNMCGLATEVAAVYL